MASLACSMHGRICSTRLALLVLPPGIASTSRHGPVSPCPTSSTVTLPQPQSASRAVARAGSQPRTGISLHPPASTARFEREHDPSCPSSRGPIPARPLIASATSSQPVIIPSFSSPIRPHRPCGACRIQRFFFLHTGYQPPERQLPVICHTCSILSLIRSPPTEPLISDCRLGC